MSTYRELVNMVGDELKNVSDDAHFTDEHVIYLLGKVRALLLKQRYSDLRKVIPESNYQTICVDLEKTEGIPGVPCTGTYLKSTATVPNMMEIGAKRITSIDFFNGNFNYVNNQRFRYAGSNPRIQNQIYGTIAPDKYLYLKSNNNSAYYLKKVRVTGIFEDVEKALELQCEGDSGNACDIMDKTFPIEESLVSPMLQMIVQELSAFKFQPADNINNANDDLSSLAAFIRNELQKGYRSDLYKQL